MVRQAAPVWLFVHVPKTAGSSLAAELATDLSPYRSLHIDHLDRARPAPERYDTVVEEALSAYRRQPFRFASGHVQHRHLERFRDSLPAMRAFTMLRDPTARLVSDYLYQRSPMHPLAEEVKRRVPDFEAFVLLPGQRNRTARHLVPKPIFESGDAAAAIRQIEQDFCFLGLLEDYAHGFRALTALLGNQRSPVARLRVNAAAAPERAAIAERLTNPALVSRIAGLNALDLAIHHHFLARWQAVQPALTDWLAPYGNGTKWP